MRRSIMRAMQAGDVVVFPMDKDTPNRFMGDIESLHSMIPGSQFNYRGLIIADTLTGKSYKAVRVECITPMPGKKLPGRKPKV